MKLHRLLFGLLLPCLVVVLSMSGQAHAADAANWSAGHIIDDVVFQNSGAMTVDQIQQFLDAKVPVCDTYGSKQMWSGGPSRSTWAQNNGKPLPPYTCLKNYVENPNTNDNNIGDPNKQVVGGVSAAQLIFNSAQKYRINPQVLLVVLQKEQTLITDDWPWPIQYQAATGSNCPDTAACNPLYAGFARQIDRSGYLFNSYIAHPSNYNFGLGWNTVRFNPDVNCGTQNVFIENLSTAALYDYTPYTPNQAALDNLYGTGDGCSAYGNRNFWRQFTDWFGSTTVPGGSVQLTKSVTIAGDPYVGNKLTVSYDIKNSGSFTLDSGPVWICASYAGNTFGFGGKRVTLAPNDTVTISGDVSATVVGNLTVWLCGDVPGGPGWTPNYPYAVPPIERMKTISISASPIKISTSMSSSLATPHVGEATTLSYTVRNTGTNPVDTGNLWICAFLNGIGTGGGGNRQTLAPNATMTLSMPYTPNLTGTLNVRVCGNTPNGPGWVPGYPDVDTGMTREITLTVTTP